MNVRLHTTLLAALLCACSTPAFQPRVVIPPRTEHAPRVSVIDVEHYTIELALDPAARSIRGTCRVRLYPRSDGLSRVQLDLVDLTVDAVLDERGRQLAFDHDGAVLTVELPRPVPATDSVELEVRYHGAPRKGLVFAAERDGVPTQVYSHGECEDSRYWFPCWDDPAERATSEVIVTLPPGWISVGAGECDSSTGAGAARVDRWRIDVPHPVYLTTLVAGELVAHGDAWGGLPLTYVAAPHHERWLDDVFAITPEVLDYLSDLTGQRYPYAKYAQSAVDNFPFGGMENVSATTLTDLCMQDELGRRDQDWSYLIVHEAAHQWFGNLLTCADWSHIWLNEGFATYCEKLYLEATEGLDVFRVGVRDMQDAYVALDVGVHRRPHVWNVYRDPFDLFVDGGQAYPGGASRLHLLRFVVGDEAFFRGLRRYVADQRGRAVVTADFRRAMEAESGLQLRWFFEQWFERPGYPEFQVAWTWDERRGVVQVDVEQVQKPLNGTPSVFVTPVDIELRDTSGARRQRVTIDRRRQSFEFPAPTPPLWVVFDKYGWIPKRCVTRRSLDEWLALAEQDDDVNGRRAALTALGHELAERSDEAERWRIAEAILQRLGDSSAAVRASAARAFGRVYTPPEHPISVGLMRAASSDADVAVRSAALQTLAGWDRNEGFAGFGREQFEARYSWATMGAAAALVASAEGARALPWLESKLELESPHDDLAAGVVAAIARVRGARSIELLRGVALDESFAGPAREAAVRALGTLARSRTDVSRELAELLARTSRYRLQAALIDTLGACGDPRALAALEDFYARTLDSRHRRAIEEVLLRASS